MKRRAVLGGALLAASVARSQSSAPGVDERLRQILERARAGEARPPAAVSAGDLQLREELLRTGEAALARLELEPALAAFERAAMILHAADTEMGLVRTYMQSGQYRRALAFGAHTAGAHLDVIGGTALYAWLLHRGGQDAIARQLLAQARDRAPGQPLLSQVEGAVLQGRAMPSGALQPPARLAPYSQGSDIPARARVVASATLVAQGRMALVPASVVMPGRRYWVRNGLGEVSGTRASPRRTTQGLALLALARPLPSRGAARAPADAFPGSVGLAVEFDVQTNAQPAWPRLVSGFIGSAESLPGVRRLGIGLQRGPARGGPVFDASGLLAGVALATQPADLLVTSSRVQQLFGADLLEPAPAARPSTLGHDAIYEAALGMTLQLVAA